MQDLQDAKVQTSITVTLAAQQHFKELLAEDHTPHMQLRMVVEGGGTSKAEVGIEFCPLGEAMADDLNLKFPDFILFVPLHALPLLENAHIDLETSATGKQLAIKAPFIRGRLPSAHAPLIERVEFLLASEINPSLAGHSGRVSLEMIEEGVVYLRFGGGCHGCGMANVTLAQTIEKSLKEAFPEIVGVKDITDHSQGKDPYC